MCEPSRDCMFNMAKTTTLRDGSPGVCVMGGMACPSFMSYSC